MQLWKTGVGFKSPSLVLIRLFFPSHEEYPPNNFRLQPVVLNNKKQSSLTWAL